MSLLIFSLTKILLSLYQSFSCFKSIKNEIIEDYSKWLEYWTVYGVFSISELFLDLLFDFLPFYYLTKLLLLLLFVSPLTSGSEVVFHSVVRPVLYHRERHIEEQAGRLRSYLQLLLSRFFASLSVSLSNDSISELQPLEEEEYSGRNSRHLIRRLSVDSLLLEDEYIPHRFDMNPRRQNYQDYYRTIRQEYSEHIPAQSHQRSLEYDGRFEHYSSDYDRYLPRRHQDYYNDEYKYTTVPRRRSGRYEDSLEPLEDEAWMRYRGQWRSLYDGLDCPQYTRRSQRSGFDRNYSRRAPDRHRYQAETTSYNYPRRNLYEYYDYDRNDDFL